MIDGLGLARNYRSQIQYWYFHLPHFVLSSYGETEIQSSRNQTMALLAHFSVEWDNKGKLGTAETRVLTKYSVCYADRYAKIDPWRQKDKRP